jgi:hypothetical protein
MARDRQAVSRAGEAPRFPRVRYHRRESSIRRSTRRRGIRTDDGSLSRWGSPIGRPFCRPVKSGLGSRSADVPAQLTDPSQLSTSRSA